MKRLAIRIGYAMLLVIAGNTGWAFGDEIKRPVMARVQPDYPMLALRMHLEDTVVVEVTAKPDGSAAEVHAISGHPLLRRAAEDCVSRWRFLQMKRPARGTVSVVFSPSEQ